jgi:hypothetical protein
MDLLDAAAAVTAVVTAVDAAAVGAATVTIRLSGFP